MMRIYFVIISIIAILMPALAIAGQEDVIFSNILGGEALDEAECLRVDSLGNVIICGSTASVDFPTTDSAYCTINKSAPYGYSSCFLAKFSPAGELIFSTFWGGYWDDYAKDFVIASNGDFIVTGYTASRSTFPRTEGVFDTTGNAGYDAFLCRISADGRRMIYSTTIGGDKDDYALSVALNEADEPIITGYSTEDGDFPYTQWFPESNVRNRQNNKYDIFVTKFNATASALYFAANIGGIDDDMAQGVALDSTGNAFVFGTTRSSNFPTTSKAFSRSLSDSAGTYGDMFLLKLSSNGNLEYSTFIGGKARDVAYDAEIDGNKIYLTGYTESRNFPVLQSENSFVGANGDVVCMQLSIDETTSSAFSLVLGGSGTDRVWDMSLDKEKNIVLTGTTSSEDFPTTPNAVARTITEGENGTEAFVVKLDSLGKMQYSTYLGGSSPDVGKGIGFTNDSAVWVCGITDSKDFQGTQGDQLGGQNIFLSNIKVMRYLEPLSFEIELAGGLELSQNNLYLCQSDSVMVKLSFSGDFVGTPSIEFVPEYGVTKISDSVYVILPESTCDYRITGYDVLGNSFSDSIHIEVAEMPEISIAGPRGVLKNSQSTYSVPEYENITYFWEVAGGEIVSGAGTPRITVAWAETSPGTVACTATNIYGCIASSGNAAISVGENFTFSFGISSPYLLCRGDTLLLSSEDEFPAYLWSDGSTNREIAITAAGEYWLRVTNSEGFYGYSDTLTVLAKASPQKPVIGRQDSLLQCMIVAPAYQWYLDGAVLSGDTLKSIVLKHEGEYRVEITAKNGCKAMSDAFRYSSVKEIVKNLSIKYNRMTKILSFDNRNLTGSLANTVQYNRLRIYDLLGNLLYSGDFSGEYLLEGFTAKIILVEISSDINTDAIRKIILL